MLNLGRHLTVHDPDMAPKYRPHCVLHNNRLLEHALLCPVNWVTRLEFFFSGMAGGGGEGGGRDCVKRSDSTIIPNCCVFH